MTASVHTKLDALDELLNQSLPLLNAISSSAYFVHEGNFQYSKHREVGTTLEGWIARNRGILPADVISPVVDLNQRIAEWASSMGTTATPANFARDPHGSFSEVQRVLGDYKDRLLRDLDTREENLRVRVAREMRSPWASGSFYLVAAIVVLATLAVVGRVLPAWTLPIVLIAAVTLLTIIGAFQLRNDEKLQEKTFIQLLRLAFGALPLLVKRKRADENGQKL